MKKFDLQCSSCGATTRAQQNERSYCMGCGKPQNADACKCGAWIPHFDDLPRARHCRSCGSDAHLIKGAAAIPIGIYQTAALTAIIGYLATVYLNRLWPGSPPTLVLHAIDQAHSDALKWILSHPTKANWGMALLLLWALEGVPIFWAGLFAFLSGSRGRYLLKNQGVLDLLLYDAMRRCPRAVKFGIHLRHVLTRAVKKPIFLIKSGLAAVASRVRKHT